MFVTWECFLVCFSYAPPSPQERLSFAHLVHLKFSSDTIRLAVLRDGQRLFLDVPVAPPARLIPTTTFDEPVPYFIYGGLVFVPFTEPYLHEWGEEWQADAPHELVNLLLSGAGNITPLPARRWQLRSGLTRTHAPMPVSIEQECAPRSSPAPRLRIHPPLPHARPNPRPQDRLVMCGLRPTFTLSGIPSRPADQHQRSTPSTPL